jgi:hypothetical protein
MLLLRRAGSWPKGCFSFPLVNYLSAAPLCTSLSANSSIMLCGWCGTPLTGGIQTLSKSLSAAADEPLVQLRPDVCRPVCGVTGGASRGALRWRVEPA